MISHKYAWNLNVIYVIPLQHLIECKRYYTNWITRSMELHNKTTLITASQVQIGPNNVLCSVHVYLLYGRCHNNRSVHHCHQHRMNTHSIVCIGKIPCCAKLCRDECSLIQAFIQTFSSAFNGYPLNNSREHEPQKKSAKVHAIKTKTINLNKQTDKFNCSMKPKTAHNCVICCFSMAPYRFFLYFSVEFKGGS